MFHNLKADIIYYKTATDFELEFNLCGCCRMRLLSDKTPDKKSFVLSLARAVSRSNVILVAGALFGENNIIKLVTEAINTSTEIVDNATFGISDEQQIEIIKASTPLVTSDGYFGGCIIESGPQTMILLTDNKSMRKTIMKTLIHPYIEELYAAETGGETEPKQENDTSNSQIILEDDYTEEESYEVVENQDLILGEDDYIEDSISEEDILLGESIVMDDDDSDDNMSDDEETFDDLFFEPTKLDRRTVERFTEEYMSQNTDYHEEEDYYKINNPYSKNPFSLSVLIISIILLLVLVVLCYCIFFVPKNQGIEPVTYLQEIYNTLFG